MKEFGIIHVRFWDWAMENKLPDQAKIVAAYMLTCRHANSLGCFRLPKDYLNSDLGYPIDTLSIPYRYLIDTGFLCFCEGSKWVFLPKYLLWNPPQNHKHAKGIVKHIQHIPSSFQYKDKLLESCRNYLFPFLDKDTIDTATHTLSIPYRYAIDTQGIPYRYTNTDTYTDTNTNTKEEEPQNGIQNSGPGECQEGPPSSGEGSGQDSEGPGKDTEDAGQEKSGKGKSRESRGNDQSRAGSQGRKKDQGKGKELNPEYLVLSRQYLEEHKRLYPDITKSIQKSQVDGGAAALDQLIRLDGYDLETIRRAVFWAIRDDFWHRNLQSLSSLRKKGKNSEIKFKNILASMRKDKGKNAQYTKDKDYGQSNLGIFE